MVKEVFNDQERNGEIVWTEEEEKEQSYAIKDEHFMMNMRLIFHYLRSNWDQIIHIIIEHYSVSLYEKWKETYPKWQSQHNLIYEMRIFSIFQSDYFISKFQDQIEPLIRSNKIKWNQIMPVN